MNDQEILDRFEELEAGRILGDLDAAELAEWEELSKDPRCEVDLSLEITAAALESNFENEEELPRNLLKELEAGMSDFVLPESKEAEVVRPSIWRKIAGDSETAWLVAAVLAILLVGKFMMDSAPESQGETADNPPPSPAEAMQSLLGQANDIVESEFGGVKAYEGMSGKVVWSDSMQEGYMILTNLPANEPTAKQYQLWIVDPDRDEKPVDGGVFDIPTGDGTTIIPIRNPLVVNDPKAFVITLEQPGGVVVSKQEVVVALAKTS
ncbi:anti-sigma factor [Akkermansiaceae bacterium]|nr:anti-sigma factor [Akkermansiaceae bacterium]MDB4484210.1 anti-sigma factor [bacterium]MDB4509600.1 anti-sigma factor [Akkermansiaceae bacterium]MDF1712918.1 anti-sigma factor [Akkermansiaceae bacterium]